MDVQANDEPNVTSINKSVSSVSLSHTVSLKILNPPEVVTILRGQIMAKFQPFDQWYSLTNVDVRSSFSDTGMSEIARKSVSSASDISSADTSHSVASQNRHVPQAIF